MFSALFRPKPPSNCLFTHLMHVDVDAGHDVPDLELKKVTRNILSLVSLKVLVRESPQHLYIYT